MTLHNFAHGNLIMYQRVRQALELANFRSQPKTQAHTLKPRNLKISAFTR